MSLKNIHDAMYPLYLTTKIFGLTLYQIENQKYKYKRLTLLNLIHLICLIIPTTCMTIKFTPIILMNRKKINVTIFYDSLLNFQNTFIMPFCLYLIGINYQKLCVQTLNKLIEIDKKINLKYSLYESYKKIRYIIYIQLIVIFSYCALNEIGIDFNSKET